VTDARFAARPAWRLIAALAAAKLAEHLITNVITPYGFHRDEFLYFAMGRHLQLFRMDFPPAIAILADAVRGTLGDGLFGIRLVPALFATLLLVLAGLAVLASPLFLRSGNLF